MPKQAICKFNSIEENQSKGFQVGSEAIFIVKKDNQLHAFHNKCPHININLETMPNQFLNLDKTYIQCSNHGALFEIETGKCISGPCFGEYLMPINAHVEDGQIWVDLG